MPTEVYENAAIIIIILFILSIIMMIIGVIKKDMEEVRKKQIKDEQKEIKRILDNSGMTKPYEPPIKRKTNEPDNGDDKEDHF